MKNRYRLIFYIILLSIVAIYHIDFLRPMQGPGVSGLLGIMDIILWLFTFGSCVCLYVAYQIIKKTIVSWRKITDHNNSMVWIAIDFAVMIGFCVLFHLTILDIKMSH